MCLERALSPVVRLVEESLREFVIARGRILKNVDTENANLQNENTIAEDKKR